MFLDDKLQNEKLINLNDSMGSMFVFGIIIKNITPNIKEEFKIGSDLKCDFIFYKKNYDLDGNLNSTMNVEISNLTLYHKDLNGGLNKKYNQIFFDQVTKQKLTIIPNNFASVMNSLNDKILNYYS